MAKAKRQRGADGATRRAIYAFIEAYVKSFGYPPSMREIAAGVGNCSTATVYRHLNALAEEGLLVRQGSKARALRLVAI